MLWNGYGTTPVAKNKINKTLNAFQLLFNLYTHDFKNIIKTTPSLWSESIHSELSASASIQISAWTFRFRPRTHGGIGRWQINTPTSSRRGCPEGRNQVGREHYNIPQMFFNSMVKMSQLGELLDN